MSGNWRVEDADKARRKNCFSATRRRAWRARLGWGRREVSLGRTLERQPLPSERSLSRGRERQSQPNHRPMAHMCGASEFTELSSAGPADPIELVDLSPSAHTARLRRLTGGAGAIHYAAQDGHLDVLDALLSENSVYVNAQTRTKAWAALHFAAHQGRLDAVQLLLKRGASVYLASAHGRTPLHLALQGDHRDVAQALLDHACAEARRSPRWVRSFEYGRCCMRCTAQFGWFCSKHHCRACGCAVCASCSGGRLFLDRWLSHTKPHELQCLLLCIASLSASASVSDSVCLCL